MTTARYLAYRRVQAWMDALPPEAVGGEERETLRDCAEGLLLTRDGDTSSYEVLLDQASLVLAMLFGAQQITAAQSELMWNGLVACGPAGGTAPSERRPSFSAA